MYYTTKERYNETIFTNDCTGNYYDFYFWLEQAYDWSRFVLRCLGFYYGKNEKIMNALDEVLTLEEAAEAWGKTTDSLRQACISRNGKPARFHIGVEARQSKRIWLVTKSGMIRLYGEPPQEQ